MSINAPIQGTATGDIIKLAMVRVSDYLKKTENIKILAQVHDELILEIKDTEIKKMVPEIKKIMEELLNPIDLDKKYKQLVLMVDVSVGKNWGEL